MNIKTIMTALMLSTAAITLTLPPETLAVEQKSPFVASKKDSEKQIKKAEVAKQRADKAKKLCKDKNKLNKWQYIYDAGVDCLRQAKEHYNKKDYTTSEDHAWTAVTNFNEYREYINKK